MYWTSQCQTVETGGQHSTTETEEQENDKKKNPFMKEELITKMKQMNIKTCTSIVNIRNSQKQVLVTRNQTLMKARKLSPHGHCHQKQLLRRCCDRKIRPRKHQGIEREEDPERHQWGRCRSCHLNRHRYTQRGRNCEVKGKGKIKTEEKRRKPTESAAERKPEEN